MVRQKIIEKFYNQVYLKGNTSSSFPINYSMVPDTREIFFATPRLHQDPSSINFESLYILSL